MLSILLESIHIYELNLALDLTKTEPCPQLLTAHQKPIIL